MESYICEHCKEEILLDIPRRKIVHLSLCKSYRQVLEQRLKDAINILTKEYLIEEYLIKEKSISAISRELKINRKKDIVRNKLIEYDIKLRTKSEEKHTKFYISQTNKTCQERYNSNFPSSKESINYIKLAEIQNTKQNQENYKDLIHLRTQKIKQTKLKKYNDKNYVNSEKAKQTRNNRTQEQKLQSDLIRRQKCFILYGVYHPSQRQEIKEKKIKSRLKNKGNNLYSKSSQKLFWNVYNQLENKEHIYFGELNKEFGQYDIINKKGYFYDFVDTINKKVIEFNGDYWHMNPLIYESTSFNKSVQLTAQEIWNNDCQKIKYINSMNYDVLVIWHSEYKKNKEFVINKCLEFLAQKHNKN